MVFCPLYKKSLGNPYLKFRDFSHFLVVDTPMNYFSQKILFTSPTALLGHPVQHIFVALIKKIFLQALEEVG